MFYILSNYIGYIQIKHLLNTVGYFKVLILLMSDIKRQIFKQLCIMIATIHFYFSVLFPDLRLIFPWLPKGELGSGESLNFYLNVTKKVLQETKEQQLVSGYDHRTFTLPFGGNLVLVPKRPKASFIDQNDTRFGRFRWILKLNFYFRH